MWGRIARYSGRKSFGRVAWVCKENRAVIVPVRLFSYDLFTIMEIPRTIAISMYRAPPVLALSLTA